MPRRKTEGENNNLTDSIYEPDMAPLAKEKTDVPVPDSSEKTDVPVPDSSEKTGVFVRLVNGGSFHVNGYVFKKGENVLTDEKTAEALISTGFFERA